MEGQRGRTGSGIHRSLAGALATAQLRRLQVGWAVSAVGGWVFFVALSVYAFDAGGATAVGAAALTRMVPAGLAAPLAGVLADRYSRRDVLFGAIVARALLLVGIGAAVAASAPLAVVLALGALFTIVATAHRPAQAALLPSLVETPHQLAASNAVWSAIDNGAFLVGAALSGALIATTSMADAFFVTAALFAVAAWPIARIERDPVPEYRARAEHARPIADAVYGFREVASDSRLRLVVGVLSISTMVEGAIDVLVATHQHWDHLSGFDQARDLFDQVTASGAPQVACDSETCRWQIAHGTKLPSVHPIDYLHRAYGLGANGAARNGSG